jgi:DNA polymerase I-like protein with 3'-5' exonuclease and polymerase domains
MSQPLQTAICLLHDRLKKTGIKIIASIYDGIILEAPEYDIEMTEHILKDFMVEAGQAYLKNVPFVVDVSVVGNWAEK